MDRSPPPRAIRTTRRTNSQKTPIAALMNIPSTAFVHQINMSDFLLLISALPSKIKPTKRLLIGDNKLTKLQIARTTKNICKIKKALVYYLCS